MDTIELKIFAARKKTNFSQIDQKLGMTKQGFTYAVKHDTFKPDRLKMLAEILDVVFINGEIKQAAVDKTSSAKTKLQIQIHRQEHERIISAWNEIKKLNKEASFSMDCFFELQARVSSKLAFIDRSIQDHEKLL